MMNWVYIMLLHNGIYGGRVVGVYHTRKQAESALALRADKVDCTITPWAVTKYDA